LSYAIETIELVKKYPQIREYSDLIRHPFRKKETTALRGINLKIEKGGIFCLLGPNGAGKTSLIKILCTLVLPTSGKALVGGLDVEKDSNLVKQKFGFVVNDERSFYWRLTGRENLAFFAQLNNLSPSVFEERIQRIAQLLKLDEFLDRMFKDYSTGTRQKFSIARGLLTDPEILLMDEPTRSLDPSTSKSLIEFIKSTLVAANQKTILVASHNLQAVEALADKMAVIRNGEISLSGSLAEIKEKLKIKKRYLIDFDENGSQFREIRGAMSFNGHVLFSNETESRWGVEINNSQIKISDVLSEIVALGGRIQACRATEPNLTDIYETAISE